MITLDNPFLNKGDRLVVLGDSITANPGGYIRMLTSRLAARGVEVINAGRGGEKTPWALTRLVPDVIERKPDAVAVFLGTNDSMIGRQKWADEPKVNVLTYADNLKWIVYLCRGQGIERFSIVTPFARPEGTVWHEFGDVMKPYALAAREVAGDLRVPVVPLDTAFEQAWASRPGHDGLLLTRDGIHPNDRGQSLIVQTMMTAWRLTD